MLEEYDDYYDEYEDYCDVEPCRCACDVCGCSYPSHTTGCPEREESEEE